MAKIPLAQRTQLPPSRVGAVKPPLSLADDTTAQAGKILAEVAAAFQGKLVQTKAANEISQFQGEVATAKKEWEGFVAANPGAGFDVLQVENDRMFTRLEVAGQKATTGSAKRFNADWFARNKKLLRAQSQIMMQTIKTKQETAISEAHVKQFMTNLDSIGLHQHYFGEGGTVESGLYTREFAEAKFLEEGAIITNARKKLAISNSVGAGFRAWQQTVTPANPDGDLNVAFDVIDALDIPDADKQEIESELKSRVTNRRGEARLQLEAVQEADLDTINKLIYSEQDYTQAVAAVESSSLDEKTQGTLLADIGRRATAAAKGVPLTNDRVEEHRLYEKGLDIWRGAVTKKEFDADLLVNSNKLDDNAYQRVATNAATTLKSSQAEALTRADKEIIRAIVDFSEENAFNKFISDTVRGLEPDAADLFKDEANENRQLQFWAVSRYNAELRQWIEENPDKLGKDFFQFSESLKHEYRNRSIEDLEALRVEREAELRGPVGPPAGLFGQALPTIQAGDRAAYDKLPSGTRYRDAQGNTAVKQ